MTSRVAEFVKSAPEYLKYVLNRRDQARAKVPTGWHPSEADLRGCAGLFRHDGYGDLLIAIEGDHLTARLGRHALTLHPAVRDFFAGYPPGPLAAPETFAVQRNATGQVAGVEWQNYGIVFRRDRP